MEYWFTYKLQKNGRIVRIGKGHCPHRSSDSVGSYLERRYGKRRWDGFTFMWHSSEAAAFKRETREIDRYVRATGSLPPWNRVRGGGGGQTYFRCRAMMSNGEHCSNLAVSGNYGFCKVHRP